jgi:hypothetical protein
MKKALAFLIGITSLIPFCSSAQQPTNVKYSLFHPVPKEKMREMETDRPGITESPYTIDAGHYQYETDLLNYEKVSTETSVQKTLLINHFNLKVGLTNNLALQLGFESFGSHKETDLSTGEQKIDKGIGNLNIRVKQNLIGNARGTFAASVLPYINVPTSKYQPDSRFEYGIIVPMELKLPKDWKLSMQLEGNRLMGKESAALHTAILQSLTISHDLVKDLEGMAETYYTYDFKDKSWSNFLNAALQYDIGENVKIDVGLSYGLQQDAEKTYYLGMAFRF